MRSLFAGNPQFGWVTGVSSWLVIASGGLVLIGNAFGLLTLNSTLPAFLTMQAATALGFVLIGTSLHLLKGAYSTVIRRIAQSCALIPAALGIVVTAHYLSRLSQRSAPLPLLTRLEVFAPFDVENIALPTALNFGLVGIALLLLHENKTRYRFWIQFLTVTAGVFSLQALIGYFYNVEGWRGDTPFLSMHLHTILTFLVLCVGTLFVDPKRGCVRLLIAPNLIGFLARRLLFAAIAIPFSLGGLIVLGQYLSWYSLPVGISILVGLTILFLLGLIGWCLLSLEQLDTERRGTVLALYDRELLLRTQEQIEQELRRSEAIFRSYFELPLIGIGILSPEQRWLEVNPKLCEILGYSREELLGLRWTDLTHPDDRMASNLHLDPVISGETDGYSVEQRFLHKNGDVIFTHISIRCNRHSNGSIDYVVALVQDISERKQEEANRQQAQDRLQRQEHELRTLLDNTPDAIIRCDRQFRYLYVNPTVERLTGIPKSGFLGKTIREVGASTELCNLWENTITTVFATEQEQVIEFEAAFLSGSRYYQSRIVPEWGDEDGPHQALIVSRDITELKRTQQQWLQEQIARSEAETANRMKDEFLAVLSHELRTPLNAILGWSRLLQTRTFDPQTTQQALETIERNAKLQTQLVNDLLDISCILQDRLLLHFCSVDLLSIMQDAIATIQPAAEAKQIKTYFSLLPPNGLNDNPLLSSLGESSDVGAAIATTATVDSWQDTDSQQDIDQAQAGILSTASQHSPFKLMADPKRLQQLFWNLLSNAVKFTPPHGQINVILSSLPLAQTTPPTDFPSGTMTIPLLNQSSSYAQVTIQDTGVGIRPDFLPYVFDCFRQSDRSITRFHSGLGLGLSIVHHLVQMHGGWVTADSSGEGQGATFTVYLPLQPVQDN